jgi:hypothetical protein
VVDKETPSDARTGVNFNAGPCARELRDYARECKPSGSVETMRHPMKQDGVKAGIAQDDFEHTARCRIAPEDSIELLADMSGHASVRRHCWSVTIIIMVSGPQRVPCKIL